MDFCLALYSDRPALAPALAGGRERQPCSHTSRAGSQGGAPPPAPQRQAEGHS